MAGSWKMVVRFQGWGRLSSFRFEFQSTFPPFWLRLPVRPWSSGLRFHFCGLYYNISLGTESLYQRLGAFPITPVPSLLSSLKYSITYLFCPFPCKRSLPRLPQWHQFLSFPKITRVLERLPKSPSLSRHFPNQRRRSLRQRAEGGQNNNNTAPCDRSPPRFVIPAPPSYFPQLFSP